MAEMAEINNLLAIPDYDPVIRRFQKSAPVPVVSLAEGLGLSVWTADLPNNISGMIVKDLKDGGSAGYSITVNENHAPVRQRFTIAHEIGHFLLHRERIGNGLQDDAMYRSGLSTLQEVQANRMAADILMPFTLIEKAINSENSDVHTIEDLAKRFQVSRQAMSIRLEVPDDANCKC